MSGDAGAVRRGTLASFATARDDGPRVYELPGCAQTRSHAADRARSPSSVPRNHPHMRPSAGGPDGTRAGRPGAGAIYTARMAGYRDELAEIRAGQERVTP